jgi:hypothetical protein
MFCNFFGYANVLVFYVLGLNSCIVATIELIFGLDVVNHSRYFYIMCCECGDSDGYRC